MQEHTVCCVIWIINFKFVRVPIRKVYEGMEIWLHTFLTSELDGNDWLSSRPSRFTAGERAHSTHRIACMGGRARMVVL
jgi:hypothetical protein